MRVTVKSGKYVVAVSGGVDSVALLDVLSHKPNLELVIAHFDHGIRADSAEDRKFVEKLAKLYGLEFLFSEGKLGPATSEALARQKRYEFLRKVQSETDADAIITAHHQDDVLETAILNLLRGTNRQGLSSLRSTKDILRPLLHVTKFEIREYAKENQLTWREDSTNKNEKYLRNYIRHHIMPRLSSNQQAELLKIIKTAQSSNAKINLTLDQVLDTKLTQSWLDRHWFMTLPHPVAKEIMSTWLMQNKVELSRRRVEDMTLAAKTLVPGKKRDVDNKYVLEVRREYLALIARER